MTPGNPHVLETTIVSFSIASFDNSYSACLPEVVVVNSIPVLPLSRVTIFSLRKRRTFFLRGTTSADDQLSDQNQMKSKKDHRVRRCFIFHPKLREGKKKIIAAAGRSLS